MSITVDVRGFNCPTPVIKTKAAMESAGTEDVLTIVDNAVARDNVKRLGEKMGYEVKVEEKEGGFYVNFSKACGCQLDNYLPQGNDYIILICSDKMGEGALELGQVLIKGYFYALTEAKPYPQAILFINSGVNLTTEGSEVIEYIKNLEKEGVEILSCGTCLDFYGLKEKLQVGGISNMYTIVDKMKEAAKVIRI